MSFLSSKDFKFAKIMVNFTNIIFKDPKSAKNTVKPSVFFMLFGSASVKAFRKMLVKSTPLGLDHISKGCVSFLFSV